MKKLSFLIFGATMLFVAIAILIRMFVHKVGPDEIGVRTQNFAIFGETGVFPHDYNEAGWYRNLWTIDTWHTFDKTVQTLRMNGAPGEGSPLTIKSKDGYDVTVHVGIKYRIRPGEAYKVLKNSGADPRSYQNLVANETSNACRIRFGRMLTDEFYNPKAREVAAREIEDTLQETLKERHLEIVDILISGVQFDPQYEKKIKDKKLADQDVKVNMSRAIAAEYKGQTAKVTAETQALMQKIEGETERQIAELKGTNDVAISKILEGAQAYALKRRTAADALLKEAHAVADLKLRQAEAEGERARAAAMTGPGGRALVALEAARNLRIGAVDFSSQGINVFDVEAMAIKLGAPR